MKLSILTAERAVAEAETTELYAPGAVGQLGILPDHVTFLGVLGAGELSYKGPGGMERILMAGGVVEVVGDTITVLADAAVRPADLDFATARKDLEEAEALLNSLDPVSEEYEAALVARRWATVRVEAAG